MKLVQKILKVVLPLLFGVGLFYFLMSKVDFCQVREVLSKGISWMWVAISLTIGLFSHIVRGVRWRLQIRTLGVSPSTHDMSVSVFGNYGLNLVFPRLGEIWRCNYIANSYGVSFAKTLGTMISERIVDMISSVCIALLAFVLESHIFFEFFRESGGIGGGIVTLLSSPAFYIALAFLAGAVYLCRRFFADNPIYIYLLGMVKNVWTGIKSLKDMPNKWSFFALTVLMWLLYYLNSYCGVFFFDFTSHLTPVQGLLIFIMGSVSLIVPVQGGLGAWHAVVIFTLGCYGFSPTEAFAFASVYWLIQEGFVAILGVYALLAVLFKGKLKRGEKLN